MFNTPFYKLVFDPYLSGNTFSSTPLRQPNEQNEPESPFKRGTLDNQVLLAPRKEFKQNQKDDIEYASATYKSPKNISSISKTTNHKHEIEKPLTVDLRDSTKTETWMGEVTKVENKRSTISIYS